jgi:AAA+ ATPase superfamily predicted ATPase
MNTFKNPFRPGAGQPPPFLAGRQEEKDEFNELLSQSPISKNLVLTGLRGVGKTVLLETLKPIALAKGWFWAGTDLSESASVSEQAFSIRILADLAPLVSFFTVSEEVTHPIGFNKPDQKTEIKLTFPLLLTVYQNTPGLASDKLKRVLEVVWDTVKSKVHGIVLAYDEAQNLKDKAADKEYPLSLLLEVVQYLQRKEIPYLLVLTGLPTLFPNLVETRTYAERMFHIITLDKLNKAESRDAVIKPIEAEGCPVTFTEPAILEIVKYSGGYPYFIQFFCKEIFDSYLQQLAVGIKTPAISVQGLVTKLDTDFYSGRWSRITDRQRDLLTTIAKLPSSNDEFTIQDIAAKSAEQLGNPFKPSQINQLLNKLIEYGLIFKNRHGKYSFAVPMLADYINRQVEQSSN